MALENLTNKEIKYFKEIDKRLRKSIISNSDFYGKAIIDKYTDSKLKDGEMQIILDLTIKKKDLVIYPINTSLGFAVGFQFIKFSRSKENSELLLRFRESQLPKNYTFENLSPFFMREENVKKAEYLGRKVINNRDSYDY